MTDFLTNAKAKLTYAYSPKKYELEAFATTEITTANTVSTLATHSANTFKSADHIRLAYRLVLDNQSGNNEDFTYTLDLGDDTFTRTFTHATTDTDVVGITADLTRINSTTFLALVNFMRTTEAGTITQFPVITTITDTRVTEVTIKAENTSTVDAGCDLIGNGGYVVVDTFEAQ